MAPSILTAASSSRSQSRDQSSSSRTNSLHKVNKTKTTTISKTQLGILNLAKQISRRGTRSDPIDLDVEILFPGYSTSNVVDITEPGGDDVIVKREVAPEDGGLFVNMEDTPEEEESLFVPRQSTPEEYLFVSRESTPEAEEESLFVTRASTPLEADNNPFDSMSIDMAEVEEEDGSTIIPIPLHSSPPTSQEKSTFLTTLPIEIHLLIMDQLQQTQHTITLLPGTQHTHPLTSLSHSSRALYHIFSTWKRKQSHPEFILHPRFGLFIPRLTVFNICWIGTISGRNSDEKLDQMFQRIYSPDMARRHLRSLELWQDGMDTTASIHHSLINLIVSPHSPHRIRPAQHETDSPGSGVYDFPVLDVRCAKHDGEWDERVREMDVLINLPARIWTRDLERYPFSQEVVMSHPCSDGRMEMGNEVACGLLEPKPYFGWEGSFTFRN
ncbi:hypothetical protein ACEPPN_001443 [Leptodophora sp. 'Broadleaf-Isolate-01']